MSYKNEEHTAREVAIKVLRKGRDRFLLKTETNPALFSPIEVGATAHELFNILKSLARETQADIIELAFAFSSLAQSESQFSHYLSQLESEGKEPVRYSIEEIQGGDFAVLDSEKYGLGLDDKITVKQLYSLLWTEASIQGLPLAMRLRIQVQDLLQGQSVK